MEATLICPCLAAYAIPWRQRSVFDNDTHAAFQHGLHSVVFCVGGAPAWPIDRCSNESRWAEANVRPRRIVNKQAQDKTRRSRTHAQNDTLSHNTQAHRLDKHAKMARTCTVFVRVTTCHHNHDIHQFWTQCLRVRLLNVRRGGLLARRWCGHWPMRTGTCGRPCKWRLALRLGLCIVHFAKSWMKNYLG